jgi:hypothetical protein
MKILNEINTIRNIMGLPILNENKLPSEIFEILSKVLDNTLKNTLKQEEKSLIRAFFKDSKNMVGELGEKFEKFITGPNGVKFIKEMEKGIDKEANPAKRLNMKIYLDSLKEFKNVGGVVTKDVINTTIDLLKKEYSFLFKKNIFGNYVNGNRIKIVKEQIEKEFIGKSAKEIVSQIETKLADAQKMVIDNKSINKDNKSAILKIISWLFTKLKNPKEVKGGITIAIVVYLIYSFIKNYNESGGSVIGAGAGMAADAWGGAKQGYQFAQSYDNNQPQFLKFLNDKYGKRNWMREFNLIPPDNNNIIGVEHIGTGDTKYFKHNGRTFIEVEQ